jgi:hypothetical protein
MNRLSLVGLLALAGCASAPSQPYRAPQVTIAGNATEQAKMTIVQRCVQNGGAVEQNTPNQLVCSVPMDDSFGSMMFRALATPKYSTKPDLKARYAFVNTGAQTYITVDTFMEYQNAFGQVTRNPVRNNQVAARAQSMLNEIKAATESAAPTANTPTAAPAADCKACQTISGG